MSQLISMSRTVLRGAGMMLVVVLAMGGWVLVPLALVVALHALVAST